MPDAARFHAVADRVLAGARWPTELVWRERRSGLTRFANNGVHQHGEVAERQCIVRVCKDGRFGVVVEADCTPEGLAAAAERAAVAAAFGPAAPGGLATDRRTYPDMPNCIPVTRDATPDLRVEGILPVTAAAAARGWTAAGAFATELTGTGVANSHGVRAWHEATDATFSATIIRPDGGSAWIERHAVDVNALDLAGARETVFAKAERAGAPERLEPGRYTVLLEPAAVGELVAFLAWLGFGARQFLDGTSFMAGKLGQSLTGERVTIADDPAWPGSPGLPFDYEGVPIQPTALIERGIGAAVVHNVTTAAEAGTNSTGHAIPQPNTVGPLPLHLVMAPGDTPRAELIRGVDDGILVTRLWYNRVVDPGRTLITGLTRDGTFRIRQGELGGRVRDFRFNESILEAFKHIVAMSDTLERTERGFMPALVIDGFTFSSVAGGE